MLAVERGFYYKTNMATIFTTTPAPGVKKCTVLGRSFFGHHHCIPSLSDPCPDLKRNNSFSLHDLYGHALAQQALPRGYI